MIDLTGFGLENTGTAYELQRVIDRFPVERVTLLAAPTSDRPFLAAQIRRRVVADGCRIAERRLGDAHRARRVGHVTGDQSCSASHARLAGRRLRQPGVLDHLGELLPA